MRTKKQNSGGSRCTLMYAHEKDETAPVVEDVHWPSSLPVDTRGVNKYTDKFHVGRTKLCQWLSFVLAEGLV